MADDVSIFRPTEEDEAFLERTLPVPGQGANLFQVSPEERQTLFQKIRGGITETPPELAAPKQLSFQERLGLAFGGTDPEFRRGVVDPLIEERRTFGERAQTFSLKQAEQQRERAGQVLSLLADQEKREAEKRQQEQANRLAQAQEVRLAANTRSMIKEREATSKRLFEQAKAAGLEETSLPQKRQIDALISELKSLRDPLTGMRFNDPVRGPKREKELFRLLEAMQSRFESSLSKQLGLEEIETEETVDDFFSFGG